MAVKADPIPLTKIVDALLYMGVIDDEEEVDSIARVEIEAGAITVEQLVMDDAKKHRLNITGKSIMMSKVVYPIDTEPQEIPEEEGEPMTLEEAAAQVQKRSML